MPLTKDERIRISEKIISIPVENALSEKLIADLGVSKAKAQDRDSGNKSIGDDYTVFIDGYQKELNKYDGNERTELIEQDYQDSANRIIQNPFFPNDSSVPTPALTNGIWKYFIPYSGNKAIGKNYLETYNTVTKEQDKIDAILTLITEVETYSDIQRSSGQHCVSTATGTCDIPAHTTQQDCIDNGGVWTSGVPIESIETYSEMQTAMSNLKTAVQGWEDFINTVDAVITTTDTDATRLAENQASRDDITASIVIIDVWQALADFDTSHGQTTCVGFNNYDVSLLAPTKCRAAELQYIKDELTARQSFITTRISQIEGYLGTVVQDLSSGDITSRTGLYGKRFGVVDLRLNIMIGSLSEVKGYERGQDAQQQLQNANDNAADTYSDIMKVVLFRAPAAGTNVIHLMDGSGFEVGDSIYVVGYKLDEISATIENKDNNTIYLNVGVSKKYTRDINSRMYKML
jgi:hypothetical protein